MADEKRITTFEWLYNNLYEFRKDTPPINKKGVTKTELTTNYNVDETKLTSYNPKQLIPRGRCVGVSTLKYLGFFGYEHSLNISSQGGDYIITISSSPSQVSSFYSFPPKENIGDGFLLRTNGSVTNTEILNTPLFLGNLDRYDELSSNRKIIREKTGNISFLDPNLEIITTQPLSDYTLSPNKVFANVTGSSSYIYNDTTQNNEPFSFDLSGYIFNNKRIYSTLSFKKSYPEETFTKTTHTILSNHNSYFVLENNNTKLKLTKISQDNSLIPSGAYTNFIDDCNENSIQLRVNYKPWHTARAFTRDVPTFSIVDKKVKFFLSRQNISGGNYPNGTKFFIRFGETDLVDNYLEYEVPTNILVDGSFNGIWEAKEFEGQWVVDAFSERDSEGFSILQRFNFRAPGQDENHTLYAKGVVNLNNLSKMMMGLRNVSGESTREEVLWVLKPTIDLSNISIRRKDVKMYNYNIYPFMASGNLEGVELIYPIQMDNDLDVLSEIGFKQEVVWERDVPNVSSAELITHRSNIEESYIKILYNGGNIETRRVSDFSLINSGAEPLTSTILSPTKNMIIYKQTDSNITDIDINGSSRQMISVVQDV